MPQEVQTQQTQAIAQREPRSLRQQIDDLKPEFAKTLPTNITADGFIRIVQTAVQLNPDLMQCTPRSLFAACMKAASDGLVLDGRQAALIARNVKISKKGQADKWEKQATYQPMVQGLMQLARNSGEISSITAQVVYDNDTFTYVLGDDERIEHKPAALDQAQGNPIAVYAIAKLKDGTVVREVMRKSQVLAIGAQGTNGYQYAVDGKNFAEWWRKTVIRRITKYIPRSSDAAGKFAQAVERIDDDYDFDGEVVPPAPRPAPKKRGGAAAALKDVTPPQQPEEPPHDEDTGEIIENDGGQEYDDDI